MNLLVEPRRCGPFKSGTFRRNTWEPGSSRFSAAAPNPSCWGTIECTGCKGRLIKTHRLDSTSLVGSDMARAFQDVLEMNIKRSHAVQAPYVPYVPSSATTVFAGTLACVICFDLSKKTHQTCMTCHKQSTHSITTRFIHTRALQSCTGFLLGGLFAAGETLKRHVDLAMGQKD